jgi:tetratricopeptide (TPR) repeat protein
LALLVLGGCASPARITPVEDRTGAAVAAAPVSPPSLVPAPQQEEPAVVVRPLRSDDAFGPGADAYAPTGPGTDGAAFAAPTSPATAPSGPARVQSSSSAVLALLDSAGEQARTGRWDASAATLERALRIEPENPVIWHNLAGVRLQQGRADQAEGFAAKSNTLAGLDRELQVRNWRIIADARRARGDSAGAHEASDRAAALGHTVN